ncbi:MAG: endolytic transglycosylase MltG [Pyrinomonadaceae bacterium]|nr:endolytic transglycosylase MltG [Pyrinomonadaceae bacterium]
MSFIRILLLVIIVAIIGLCGVGFWFYNSLNSPAEHAKANEYITIERGSTPTQIVAKLASEGIIKNQTATMLYLRTVGDASKLQAGQYRFRSPISPIEALKELEKGSVQTKRLTIPEGFTRFDIARRILENFPQDPPLTEDQILMLMTDTDLIKDIAPAARNLEGYLYPSTYNLPPDAKAADIIRTAVEQFKKLWKPEWTEQARKLGRTPHEIVTIASLIETESPLESERPIVASVIYNRLEKNMPLGIDQTAVYIAKMERRWDGTIHRSDLDSTSPYNTRKYGGIPPGPIASVSVSSIEAALNPETTDYIFYVLNVEKNDGSHHFYASAADFERGKAVYQRWLEEQRRLKREAEQSQ